MPFLKLDWHACFTDDLPALQACDDDARRAFVVTSSNAPLPAAAFEPEDVETLTRAGLATIRPVKKDLVRTPTGRQLAHLLRLAYVPPSRTQSAAPDPRQMLQSVLGAVPAYALIGQEAPAYGWGATQTRDGWSQLTVPEWPGRLVKAKTAKAAKTFEDKFYRPAANGTGGDHGPYYGDGKVRAAARQLLEHLLDQPDKIAPAELLAAFPDLPAKIFSRAFESLIRYAMVFFWTGPRAESVDLRFGLWPRVTAALHRPPADAPQTVPNSAIAAPIRPGWIREDVNALLIAATEAPLRLKSNSNDFYAADLKRLEAAFTPVDDPVRTAFEQQLGDLTDTFGRYNHPADFDERVHAAVVRANQLELLGYRESRKAPDQLATADAGRAWLGESVAAQIARLIAAAQPHLLDTGRSDIVIGFGSLGVPRTPDAARRFLAEDPADALRAAGDVFYAPPKRKLKGKDDAAPWVAAADAVRHAARHHNPLPDAIAAAGKDRKRKSGRDWERKRAWAMLEEADGLTLENAWTSVLEGLCIDHLLPLGGLDLAEPPPTDTASGGAVLARLTPVGRVLLGLEGPELLDAEAEATPAGGIIVQPNFDVVFLGPAPQAQAVLGAFAERAGPAGGVGTLFKITKKSVVSAAASGRDAAQIQADLTGLTDKPVPDNVLREIDHWAGSVRHVSARFATIIEAPDADTARRVKGALGKQTELAGDTTLVLQTKSLTSAMREKLKKQGLFVR